MAWCLNFKFQEAINLRSKLNVFGLDDEKLHYSTALQICLHRFLTYIVHDQVIV